MDEHTPAQTPDRDVIIDNKEDELATSLHTATNPEQVRFGEQPRDAEQPSTLAPSPLEEGADDTKRVYPGVALGGHSVASALTSSAAAMDEGESQSQSVAPSETVVVSTEGGSTATTAGPSLASDEEPLDPRTGEIVERHEQIKDELANIENVVEAKTLLGKPVIDLSRGKELGTVKDVVFDPASENITGFTVALPGLLGGTRSLPYSGVRGIGRDAVTVSDATALDAGQGSRSMEQAVERGYPVVGKRILSESGTFLGSVDDLIVDRQDGRVLGYRISGGILRDAVGGVHYLPLPETCTVGEDVITVPAHVEQYIQTEVGGLSGAMSTAKDRTTESADTLAGKVSQAWETTKETASNAWDSVRESTERAAEETKEATKERLIGQTVGRTVTDDAGNVLAAEGSIITQSIADRADAGGKLMALSAAALVAGARETYDTAKEKAAETYDTAKDKAADAYDTAKDTAADAQATAQARVAQVGDRIEDMTAQHLVGRVAGRSVTDEAGNILVAEGQIISLADAQRAETAGKLPALAAAAVEARAEAAYSTARSSVSGAYDTARTSVSGAYDTVRTEASDAYGAVRNEAADAAEAAQQKLSAAADAIDRKADDLRASSLEPPIIPAAGGTGGGVTIVAQPGSTVNVTGAGVETDAEADDADLAGPPPGNGLRVDG